MIIYFRIYFFEEGEVYFLKELFGLKHDVMDDGDSLANPMT